MLELGLELVDRVIQFSKYRSERKQKLFEEFVEPSFGEISTIYSDYRQMIIRVREQLKTEAEAQAIRDLEGDRELNHPLRSKLVGISESLWKKKADLAQSDYESSVAEYFIEIANLIQNRAEGPSQEAPNIALVLLDALRGETRYYPDIDEIILHLDTSFRRIVEKYAKLKIAAHFGGKVRGGENSR